MNNLINTKISLFLLVILFFSTLSFSQDSTAVEDDEGKLPVRDPFGCTMIIDNQTSTSPVKGGLEFLIHHRMGKIKEISDLYGLYAPSNIRLGFNYGINDKLMAFVGTEKNDKLQEIGLKYRIIDQTRNGKIPVSVSIHGNAVIDAKDKEFFGADFKFVDRLSYFGEVIITRKFSERLSVVVSPGYCHLNKVDSIYPNDKFGISVGGRFKFYNEMSILFEYDQSFFTKTLKNYQDEAKPNLALGFEVATPTHSFQLFMSNYDKIVRQYNYMYNINDFGEKDIRIGFNVTVRF